MIIIKMQRSLSTTASVQQVLIYNEPQSIKLELDNSPDLDKWFGSSDKVYAKASWKNSKLTIHALVKAQPW